MSGPGIGMPEIEAPTRQVNDLSQSIIAPLTWVAALTIVVVAYRMCRTRGDWLPLAMVAAAAINSLNEPLFDKLFHLYWYEPGQWTLFETYGYPQPVWVMSAYIIYFCVPGLFILHMLTVKGASREFVFKAALATAAWGTIFESIAIKIGLYTYFGPHPFRLLGDYPFWLGEMEAAHIAIWAMLLAAFAPLLTGARALLAIPAFALSFCTIMYGAGGIGLAAINVSNASTALIYAGAIGSLAMAALMVRVVACLHPSEDTPTSPVSVPTPASL